MMNNSTEQNKAVVIRFNRECIEEGNLNSLEELLDDNVINHSAAPGMPSGKEGFHLFLIGVLKKGFPDLKVEILEQVAEKDLVVTRKSIKATHTGEIMGIPPSYKSVEIKIIDIIRLHNGKYMEHWGQSNFMEIIGQISSNKN
jgi:predicted ester cyclase